MSAVTFARCVIVCATDSVTRKYTLGCGGRISSRAPSPCRIPDQKLTDLTLGVPLCYLYSPRSRSITAVKDSPRMVHRREDQSVIENPAKNSMLSSKSIHLVLRNRQFTHVSLPAHVHGYLIRWGEIDSIFYCVLLKLPIMMCDSFEIYWVHIVRTCLRVASQCTFVRL
jgi:hypothetical protein